MRIIISLLLLFSLSVQAQKTQNDSLSFKADLSLTGLYQGGNVETIIFRAKSKMTFKPLKKWEFKTQNSYVYQEFGKTKADEDVLSLNFLHFNPEKRIYPLVLGFFSTNFRREIDYRYLTGAGVTLKLFEKENNWLKFALSSEYENTRFDNTDFNIDQYDGSEELSTFRGTIWLNGKHEIFKKKLIFKHEFFYQPSLEESNNYRWQADLALEIPVWKFLDFKINYLHTFESIVVEGQKEEDQFLTFGFTIKSY